jgi:hypothetical protein
MQLAKIWQAHLGVGKTSSHVAAITASPRPRPADYRDVTKVRLPHDRERELRAVAVRRKKAAAAPPPSTADPDRQAHGVDPRAWLADSLGCPITRPIRLPTCCQ